MRMKFRGIEDRVCLLVVLVLSLGLGACAGAQDEEEDDEVEESEEDEEEDVSEEEAASELPGSGDESPDDEEDVSQEESEEEGDAEEKSKIEDPEPESQEPEPEKPKPGKKGPKQDICNETVPAKHFVDDIPAYSQCAASLNAKIWSNDGVSTATSSQGDGWVPTQWGGGYQCTEFAKRYMYFKFGVEKFPNGNAGLWCEGVTPPGLEKNSEPTHGDLIIFGPGSCGASLATGHVAVVDKVDKATKMVEFVEQNQANRRVCAISTAACFLHAKSNK